MNQITFIKLFLAGLLFIISIDSFWFSGITKSFYKSQLGALASYTPTGMNIRIIPALLSWSLLVIASIFFVLPQTANLFEALYKGALLGLVVYGVYNTANRAILTHWPILLMLGDTAWGIVSNALLAAVLRLLVNKL